MSKLTAAQIVDIFGEHFIDHHGAIPKVNAIIGASVAAAMEQAAQKLEGDWTIEWKHEPERCDPCSFGKTMAAQIRAFITPSASAALAAHTDAKVREALEEVIEAIFCGRPYIGAGAVFAYGEDDAEFECDERWWTPDEVRALLPASVPDSPTQPATEGGDAS